MRLFRRLVSSLFVLGLAGMPVVSQLACGPAAQGLSAGIRRGPLDPAAAAQHQQLVAEGDAAFAERAERAQLELAIQKYQAAVGVKDDDWQTYEKLARATYLLADGWLFFEKDASADAAARYLAVFEQGYGAAERGLAAQSREVEQKLAAGVDLKDAVALVNRDGVGLMYWYATNLGKWGNAQDITVILRYKDRIFNMMTRVRELDRQFFHGAPDRYFGAYYAVAPTFAGGDLDKSWEHFQESLKIAPDYVATYNLIAEFYAPKKQDADLFDRMIAQVRKAPIEAIPGLEAEAAIEKRKAELLVKRREAGDFPF
jgi:tetratricopeptide (TPR) repeat protein